MRDAGLTLEHVTGTGLTRRKTLGLLGVGLTGGTLALLEACAQPSPPQPTATVPVPVTSVVSGWRSSGGDEIRKQYQQSLQDSTA